MSPEARAVFTINNVKAFWLNRFSLKVVASIMCTVKVTVVPQRYLMKQAEYEKGLIKVYQYYSKSWSTTKSWHKCTKFVYTSKKWITAYTNNKPELTNRSPRRALAPRWAPRLLAHFLCILFHFMQNLISFPRLVWNGEWYYAHRPRPPLIPFLLKCVWTLPFSSHSLSVDGSVFSFIAVHSSELNCRIAVLITRQNLRVFFIGVRLLLQR